MNRPFHPILFAIYPVLALYAENTALIPVGEVGLPLLIVLGVAAVLWGLSSLVLWSPKRGAIGTSLAILCLFANGHLWDVVSKVPRLRDTFVDRDGMFWTWAIVSAALLVLACWKWKRIDGITRAFNAFGIVLVAFPAFSIGMAFYSAWRGTPVMASAATNVKLNTSVRPDIYYVILDGYGRSDAIHRVIGVDNSWFIKGLEDLGFYVAKDGRSNYCETELSLSSSLNMQYLSTLAPSLTGSSENRYPLDSLIDKNEVAKYLRKLGYRYEAITTGFPSIHPASADLWLKGASGVSLFSNELISETPLPASELSGESMFVVRRQLIRTAVQNLQTIGAGGTQPKFVFVHILAPHPPFVFTADGADLRPKAMGYTYVDGSHYYQNGGTVKMYRDGYAGQVTYLNKLVLDAVTQIVKHSSKPPVIIVQGDHGSKLKMDQEVLEKTDLNEVFPNLNAYFVPPAVRDHLYPGITPVNSFRTLFNGLFGDRFPILSDRSYFSGWSTPFKFIEVTNRIKPAGD